MSVADTAGECHEVHCFAVLDDSGTSTYAACPAFAAMPAGPILVRVRGTDSAGAEVRAARRRRGAASDGIV